MDPLCLAMIVVIAFFIFIILVGTAGFIYFFEHEWSHSVYLTLCSTSNLGLQTEVKTAGQKFFVVFMGILTTLVYLIFIGLLTAWILIKLERQNLKEVL
jgi:hypothetical protein